MANIPLERAEGWAAKICAELAPMCDAIEVAGSIRRRRPTVNDIDLVMLPRPGCERRLRERIKANAAKVNTDGNLNLIVTLKNGLQLDCFLAKREEDLFGAEATNFGTLLVCRTGSRDFNVFLCQQAERMGLHWNPYWGVEAEAGGGRGAVGRWQLAVGSGQLAVGSGAGIGDRGAIRT